jgi:hypothetical protein
MKYKMTRIRYHGFSCVLHNTDLSRIEKNILKVFILNKYEVGKMVIAQEWYPHTPDSNHIHLFFTLKGNRTAEKDTLLKALQKMSPLIPTEGGPAKCRVQVDKLYAKDFATCCVYLTNSTKSKFHDQNPIFYPDRNIELNLYEREIELVKTLPPFIQSIILGMFVRHHPEYLKNKQNKNIFNKYNASLQEQEPRTLPHEEDHNRQCQVAFDI